MILPIKRLRFDAYRAFASPHDLELRRLNVIFGKNGSGKSSLIRLPLLFERGLQGGAGTLAEMLSGEKEERAMELVHGAEGGSLTIGLDYGATALSQGALDVKLRILPGTQRTAMRSSVEIENWAWRAAKANFAMTLDAGQWIDIADQTGLQQFYRTASEYRPQSALSSYDLGRNRDSELGVLWRGLFPNMPNAQLHEACYELLQLRVLPLAAMRPVPARVQAIPLQDVVDAGGDGARVTDVLAADTIFRDGSLLRSVSDWYAKHLGWKLELRLNAQPSAPNQGSYACLLTNLKSGFQLPLSAHGTGMSQALPVVVRCMAAQQNRLAHSLLTFEEPETNLHPAAHGAMADLFIDSACHQSIPLMVETHSEMFLLRIRRRVAEGTLNPSDVAIFWVDEDPDLGSATVQCLDIEADGWIENWPYGIFAEDAEESRAIARARRRHEERASASDPEDQA